jgi:diaminopimelate epimerase
MRFFKYHALGNDYIVINPAELEGELSTLQIRLICHRNFGIGSDGILLGPLEAESADFGLRIFNPDGSEAEKSGNGLRIFSRYLWDQGMVQQKPFTMLTAGGVVESRVHPGGRLVTVEMGQVSFDSAKIPVLGERREVLNETLVVNGEPLRFCAATIGNPHCVIMRDEVSEEETRKFGPSVETNPLFPNRTNVQFMKVLDRGNIRIEIWERGAGYTLASGSSSSAAAAVARRLGLCDGAIKVHMPGGELDIKVSENFSILMTGPVTKVSEGTLSQEIFTQPL